MTALTEKYYRLLNAYGYGDVFIEGNIYPESYYGYKNGVRVKDRVCFFPNDWEEVPAPTTPTTLTDQQYESLVQKFTDTLLQSNDEFGMGDAPQCREVAEITVREWAETNQIQLP